MPEAKGQLQIIDKPVIQTSKRPERVKKNILTLTLRLHDPDEEADPNLNASWVVAKVPREDLSLGGEALIAKYITPLFKTFPHFVVKK
jgi:hypothetical protein